MVKTRSCGTCADAICCGCVSMVRPGSPPSWATIPLPSNSQDDNKALQTLIPCESQREARLGDRGSDMARIDCGNGVGIDEDELSESFVRASGPGGQNVNKVSTAVQLRFDAAQSPSLAAEVRGRLLKLAGRRATKA